MAESLDNNYLLIGKITSAFGIKGWIKVYSYTDPHQNIGHYCPWYVGHSSEQSINLKPVDCLSVKSQGKSLIAQLKDCNDRNSAESYRGLWIWAQVKQMPSLADHEFYWRDLIGLSVINRENQCLGIVHQLMETGANDVLQVNPSNNSIDNQQRLIPYVPGHYIDRVDLANKRLFVCWESDF